MPASRSFFPAAAAFALALTPALASADSFKLFTVDHSSSSSFALGDDAGNFAISITGWNPCGNSAKHCYEVGSVDSGSMHLSTTLPTLGKGATSGSHAPVDPPLGAGWSNVEELGGIFAATYDTGSTIIRGIFDGSNPYTDLLSTGSIDGGFVTSGGTVYFIDGLDNTLVVALDTSLAAAPEPGTLTLLGTGCTALAGLLARRRRSTL